MTQWRSAIGTSSATFPDATTGITFRHLGREGAGVRVSVCRYGGPESLESCCYGRDNDCNGLVSAPLPLEHWHRLGWTRLIGWVLGWRILLWKSGIFVRCCYCMRMAASVVVFSWIACVCPVFAALWARECSLKRCCYGANRNRSSPALALLPTLPLLPCMCRVGRMTRLVHPF